MILNLYAAVSFTNQLMINYHKYFSKVVIINSFPVVEPPNLQNRENIIHLVSFLNVYFHLFVLDTCTTTNHTDLWRIQEFQNRARGPGAVEFLGLGLYPTLVKKIHIVNIVCRLQLKYMRVTQKTFKRRGRGRVRPLPKKWALVTDFAHMEKT